MTRFQGHAESTRRIYEQRPYPAADEKALTGARWKLAPMEWMNALWKPGAEATAPRRILIAGCGAGSEAFAMRRRFPRAEITAVDFSPRSIAIAAELQRRSASMRNIRFLVGDLASPSLARKTGRGLDFISCHGVLSYIPNPGAVLKNLAGCLAPDGALYLGVNGAQHHSATVRKFLPVFGFEMAELHDAPQLRKTLDLADAILGLRGSQRISIRSASYLAGDLFGPLIQNLPLDEWVRIAGHAGLFLRGGFLQWRTLRPALVRPSASLLIPHSRASLCTLVDALCADGFHRLLFTRAAAVVPPWESHSELLTWRPAFTTVFSAPPPRRSRSWKALRKVAFKSPATDTRLDWQMPEWELEILRQSDGRRTLGEIIAQMPTTVPPKILRQQIYVLHQFLIINLLPPDRK